MKVFKSKMNFLSANSRLAAVSPKWWNISSANNEGKLYYFSGNHTFII